MRVYNLIFAVAGGVIVMIGAVLLPTPAPFGVPLVLFGLFLIARGSPRMRLMVRRLRTRFPGLEPILMRRRQGLPRGARYVLLTTRPRHTRSRTLTERQ